MASFSKYRIIIWRVIKVLFGAWGLAVAGVTIFALSVQIVGGHSADANSLRIAALALFLLGIPVMMRWLK
jgi:hypothetical protein